MYDNGYFKKAICPNCKVEFPQTRNQIYCSGDCYHQFVISNPEKYRHVEYVSLTCPTCGKVFSRNKQQIRTHISYCSKKCAGTVTGSIRHMSSIRTKSVIKNCEQCGKSFSTKGKRIEQRFCSRVCFNLNRSQNGWGDNNSNYRHGTNPGVAISTAKRHFPMKCIICGFDVVVAVHHILPKAEGGSNIPSNLAVLCPNHHAMADRGLIPSSELIDIVSHLLSSISAIGSK